jgi:hypothetical protein
MVILFIAGLLLVAAFMFRATFGHHAAKGSLTTSITAIPADMGACGPGEHCILVDKSCGQCCDNIAVNGKYEAAFNALFDKTCHDFMGKICRCSKVDSYPACVGGRCVLVPLAKPK